LLNDQSSFIKKEDKLFLCEFEYVVRSTKGVGSPLRNHWHGQPNRSSGIKAGTHLLKQSQWAAQMFQYFEAQDCRPLSFDATYV